MEKQEKTCPMDMTFVFNGMSDLLFRVPFSLFFSIGINKDSFLSS